MALGTRGGGGREGLRSRPRGGSPPPLGRPPGQPQGRNLQCRRAEQAVRPLLCVWTAARPFRLPCALLPLIPHLSCELGRLGEPEVVGGLWVGRRCPRRLRVLVGGHEHDHLQQEVDHARVGQGPTDREAEHLQRYEQQHREQEDHFRGPPGHEIARQDPHPQQEGQARARAHLKKGQPAALPLQAVLLTDDADEDVQEEDREQHDGDVVERQLQRVLRRLGRQPSKYELLEALEDGEPGVLLPVSRDVEGVREGEEAHERHEEGRDEALQQVRDGQQRAGDLLCEGDGLQEPTPVDEDHGDVHQPGTQAGFQQYQHATAKDVHGVPHVDVVVGVPNGEAARNLHDLVRQVEESLRPDEVLRDRDLRQGVVLFCI
mmetsp:Transcript_130901/g.407056  ORF Transcript_130901/g.407056 Transcript_130901/m.407056 type:complete len:375 (+) Transcript_130901:89-1213(+)